MYSSGSAGAALARQAVSSQPGCAVIPYNAWPHLAEALRLSDRELQVVQGVFSDKDQDAIAQSLGVPSLHVYRILQRIYVKLHIGSRAELVVRLMAEYLAFVADQPQPEFYESSYWAE